MRAFRSGTKRTSKTSKCGCRRCTRSKTRRSETAAVAELISIAVLRRHLETMDRLDIEYDFLPRESEILHLHFWDAAFAKLKEAACSPSRARARTKAVGSCGGRERAKRLTTEGTENTEEDEITEEDQKVIVRSNGTVGYVGKDIAYHMWKFGLLGRDFGYRKFFRYPNQHDCWISTTDGEKDHPHFGDVAEIYNVIDARQSEAQNTVIEALRGLGHGEAADHYTHFSYEMVALTPRCAAELGYTLSEEDKARSYIEVSGRKGFGVKADDLLDQLIASAKKEVDSRHPELSERGAARHRHADRHRRAALLHAEVHQAIGDRLRFQRRAELRGRNRPYAQYAVVRATSIFRKAGVDADAFSEDFANLSADRSCSVPGGRVGQRDLGTLARDLQDFLRDRPVHCHD